MVRRIFKMFVGCVLMLFAVGVAAQTEKTGKNNPAKQAATDDGLNKTDPKNRKQGLWFFKHEAHLGEPLFYEFGNYKDNRRNGIWTRLDSEQRLEATENYNHGVLNGTAQYYERGKLVVVGNYRGLDQSKPFDSVMVTNPNTLEDTLVIVPTDVGYTKHGLWRYYDAATGQLTREEEYQVDNLLYRREYTHYTHADSLAIKARIEQLPHNQKKTNKAPRGKRSLIE
ncbi:MAG: hypothetical protein QM642_02225 [Edaphocola sp.]